MPRRKSSVKRTRADKKRRLKNLKVKKELKKTLKKFQSLINTKSDEAKTFLKKVYSQLDKAAKKNILKPGTAKRKKSRLAKKIGKSQ
ncbi:MAG: 30S ribosomal protein S20 [Candidatus Omnitrophota bacterium]